MVNAEIVRVIGTKGYDRETVSRETAFVDSTESLTSQEFKDECDINTIIRRFGIGENPLQPSEWLHNVDISDAVVDYQSAMNMINEARDQFMSLPATLRSRFDNNPAQFVDFVSNPDNFDEIVRLGLAVVRVPEPEPEPLKVRVVSDSKTE